MVCHRVAGRTHIDGARHFDVVVTEYPLPRHLDFLEQHRAVGLIEACRERIVEFAEGVTFERLTRPDADAGSVQRHGAGNGFLLLPGSDRLQVAAPGLMTEDRAGAEHLKAVDRNPIVVFVDHAQRRWRPRAFRQVRGSPTLRIGDGMGYVDVILTHMTEVAADIVPEALADAVEHCGIHHQAAYITWEVVGRSPD